MKWQERFSCHVSEQSSRVVSTYETPSDPAITLVSHAETQLEAKCMDLVGDVRNIVNDVLALLLDDKTKKLQRAKLCDHLKNLANVFLDKRLQKAREVVTYLCKAEMSKRATQDDTYERIQRKVKRLSQSAHDRSNPETFDFDHLPSNQVTFVPLSLVFRAAKE